MKPFHRILSSGSVNAAMASRIRQETSNDVRLVSAKRRIRASCVRHLGAIERQRPRHDKRLETSPNGKRVCAVVRWSAGRSNAAHAIRATGLQWRRQRVCGGSLWEARGERVSCEEAEIREEQSTPMAKWRRSPSAETEMCRQSRGLR